jgi:hypothetical protein
MISIIGVHLTILFIVLSLSITYQRHVLGIYSVIIESKIKQFWLCHILLHTSLFILLPPNPKISLIIINLKIILKKYFCFCKNRITLFKKNSCDRFWLLYGYEYLYWIFCFFFYFQQLACWGYVILKKKSFLLC